jgi:hypothetical protein
MTITIIVFSIATVIGIYQRIRWANACRYNMPVDRFSALATARPDWIVPRPWSWKTLYGAAFVVWVVLMIFRLWALGVL